MCVCVLDLTLTVRGLTGVVELWGVVIGGFPVAWVSGSLTPVFSKVSRLSPVSLGHERCRRRA